VQVVKQDFGYDFYRTDRHCHHQLTRDKLRNHNRIDGAYYSPGNRLEQAFSIAVLTGFTREKLFGE
jgi:hypothetical protein